MDRKLPGRGSRGLTLIELMITLAILAAVLALGAPPMQGLVHGTRLRAETQRLVTAINLARSEAISRNMPVSLCPSPMAAGGDASCAGEYAGGWIIFANPDRDRQVDDGKGQVIQAFEPIPPGYTLTNRAGTRAASELITYLPDGTSRRNRTLLLCPPAGWKAEPWGVVLNRVGRARLSRGEGTCPA